METNPVENVESARKNREMNRTGREPEKRDEGRFQVYIIFLSNHNF